eukprot:CAMPEP_0172586344 /NCGR_PEP_ID=MMETSP1068-20121228/5715_1 /TAXON_ID=35684 /ORGANISM="Pseudopedinella elastica, Strain CCMP716" /LENGTH=337 /DNA_ID=CAMNT_0013381111 /DNA_START=80 /DNA_END=1093 /DNA_ORIENTATION=+
MKQVWVRLTALVLMGHPSQSFLGVKPAPVRTCLYCEEAEPVSAGSGYQGSRRKRRGGAGVKKSSNPNVRKEVAEIRENAIAQPKGVGGLFQVPADSRDKSQPDPIPSHVKFYSLENLFPEAPGLADMFDSSEVFRRELRAAARNDFFVEDPRFSKEKNDQLRAPGSSLEGNWQTITECPAITSVFKSQGAGVSALDGLTFVKRLGKLCVSGGGLESGLESPLVTGGWLDIVSPPNGRRRAAHAWHQDSGLGQYTVMLGFPNRNHYEGPGVFSHIVRLSHVMTPPAKPGPVIIEGNFPEANIMRPVYRKGCEVIVYKDCDHIHSAPDEFIRDGIWRFM